MNSIVGSFRFLPIGPLMQPRPSLNVAVLLERRKAASQWEHWGFEVTEVVPDVGQFGSTSRLLRDDGSSAIFVHPGMCVTLFRDEGEGYYLNLTSGRPVWFVMWRADESDPPCARPEIVTLSYNEAGRLLDAQERVDNVLLPADVCAWLQAFTDQNYTPEPKKRRRPVSFVAPGQR